MFDDSIEREQREQQRHKSTIASTDTNIHKLGDLNKENSSYPGNVEISQQCVVLGTLERERVEYGISTIYSCVVFYCMLATFTQ